MNANKVLAHIHGLSPNPGAWFEFKNERFKVLKAKISSESGKSGYVLDENLTIGCESSSVQILELQRQGKNIQTTKEFLLGKKIFYYQITESTNDDIWQLLSEGEEEGIVVVADGQNSGRGRNNSTWHSQKGESLIFSILISIEFPVIPILKYTDLFN